MLSTSNAGSLTPRTTVVKKALEKGESVSEKIGGNEIKLDVDANKQIHVTIDGKNGTHYNWEELRTEYQPIITMLGEKKLSEEKDVDKPQTSKPADSEKNVNVTL